MSAVPFDTRRVDAYMDYLAGLEDGRGCVAERDIYSDFGVLLLPKGSPISPRTALRLAGHRLQDPVDTVVGLRTPVTTRSLLDDMLELMASADDLRQLDQGSDASALLRHVMLQRELPRTLLQKLAVMASRFPRLYTRSLGGAALSALVARQLKWDNQRLQDVFLAAIARDIGLLHTPTEPPDIDMPLQYSAATLRHGSIAARILGLEGRYAERVLQAVADHHERPDGAGFPTGKHGRQVSASAWLINSMDMVWALRDAAGDEAGGLKALRAYLLVNASESEQDPLYALLRLLHLARVYTIDDAAAVAGADLQSVAHCAVDRNQTIGRMAELLKRLAEDLEQRVSDRATTVLAVVSALLTALRSSGLGSLETAASLSARELSQHFTPQELLDLDLTQTEFIWRVRRLVRLWPNLREELQGTPAFAALDQHFRELEALVAEVGTDSCRDQSLNT